MATSTAGTPPDLPIVNSTKVAARHIVLADAATPGAVEVLPGHWWAPTPGEPLQGADGWVSASIERRVRDHAQLQGLVLPNRPGSDGVEHRERFAAFTDPDVRMGTEWIEVTDRGTEEPLIVASPTTGRTDSSSVNVAGPDAAALLSGFREGKVAPWTPHAPIDVVDWYSAADRLAVSTDLARDGLTRVTSTEQLYGGIIEVRPDGVRLYAPPGGNGSEAHLRFAASATRARGWSVTVRFKVLRPNPLNVQIGDQAGTWSMGLSVNPFGPGNSAVYAQAGGVTAGTSFPKPLVGDDVELTAVARDGWLIFLANGATVAQLRRPSAGNDLTTLDVAAINFFDPPEILVRSVQATVLQPFLRRASPAPDYRATGVPTPGGLHGDYFLAADELAQAGGNIPGYIARVPAPLTEPYAKRLDPSIYLGGSSWMPTGPPNGEGFAVRWSGSIYLSLAAQDYRLRLGLVGMGRVWVGKTSADTAYIDRWMASSGDFDGGSLRAHLGQSDSGWYPIVIEFAAAAGQSTIALSAGVVGGSGWSVVSPQGLSPYGCWEGDLSGESHRGALDTVCNTTGLLWRIAPRTLESGEFPGRLECAARLGRDTDYVLGEAEGTEYAVEVNTADVVDQVVGDAQGLGDNTGREGLTAAIVDVDAVDRPWLLTRAETLVDITEEPLLRQRLSTILALYGSPSETIGARPRGAKVLADTFPTTGAAQLFKWEPDDGIRVQLPSIGVHDRTPRAITSITWPVVPNGIGVPTVGFRQRPRHLRETLRRLQRQTATARRRYQGQLSYLPGSLGSTNPAVAPDRYSRVTVPLGSVARLEAHVMYVSGTSTLEVNGINTGLTITRAGAYDVTAFLARGTNSAFARLTSAGAFGADLQLIATVRL